MSRASAKGIDVWRPAAWAGSLFGGLMGLFWSASLWLKGLPPLLAVGMGMASGVSSGLLFALVAVLFLRMPSVRSRYELEEDELLPGERLIDSRLANLVVRPADFGIGDNSVGDLLFLAGLRKRELVGGALHTTNLRLLFKAHRWNRLRGSLSVFLPQITRLEPCARWPYRRVGLLAAGLELEIAAIDRDALLTLIDTARREFGSVELDAMAALQADLAGVAGLQPDRALNAINRAIHRGRQAGDVLEVATGTLAALGGLLASELFDRGLAERWSRRVRGERKPDQPPPACPAPHD